MFREWQGFFLHQKSLFFFHNNFFMVYSKRHIRSRSVAYSGDTLRLADAGLPHKSSHVDPPTSMPLEYIQKPIVGIEKYKTDDMTWSQDTLHGGWRVFHQSLQSALESGDAVKAENMKNKDLIGLALCTSHAEVNHLLSMLAPSLKDAIVSCPSFVHAEVEEFFIHIGQDVEVRGHSWVIQLPPPSFSELQFTVEKVGSFGDDGRGCIQNTPHRVSVWCGRLGEPLGLTIRVGRYVPNVARALLPLAHKGSLLILSKAGMGKTTLLRDLAASLSREPSRPRVIVVDTSNEIGGDSPIPLPFLGRCRRIQVPCRKDQEKIMTQILENHSPEYVIVDEISTASEAEAAWSMSQRGVHLIATCHGESLQGLLQNQCLNLLVGGAAQAFLSNEERRLRNKSKKTILERPHSSPFHFVVELNLRNMAHVYTDVNAAVDLFLDEQDARKNAMVGQMMALDRSPSSELMGLLRSKKNRARLDTNRRSVMLTNVESGCTNDFGKSSDDDGEGDRDCRFMREWRDKRVEKSYARERLTDEKLLNDLCGGF